MLNLGQIEDSLTELSDEELEALNSRLTFLRRRSIPETEEDLVYEQMKSVFSELGQRATPPLSAIRRMMAKNKFEEASGVLLDYAKLYFKPKTKPERIKALRILMKMLCCDIRDRKIPLSHTTVVNNAKRIGDIVDIQFPGYRESGMLPLVLRQLKAG